MINFITPQQNTKTKQLIPKNAIAKAHIKNSNTSPNRYFLFPHSSTSDDDTRTRFIESLNHKIAATELPAY
ncbi:hypothetical protein Hanom_Chr06g00535861 [Helianthus anomalus]